MIDATIIIVKLFLASATALIQCYAYIAVCVCVGWGGDGVEGAHMAHTNLHDVQLPTPSSHCQAHKW